MTNFKILRPEQLEMRRKMYPEGARVRLISMDDPYNKSLGEGSLGTITGVDSLGDIEVCWDSGSHLKLIYGVDRFIVVKDSCKA